MAALLARGAYLLEIRDMPFFSSPVVDARTYLDHALSIVAGAGGEGALWQPPLYPYFLAGLISIFGERHFLLHFLHAVMGSISCVLLLFMGWKAAGRAAGIAAGFVMAFYGPIVYFDGEYLATGLTVFINLSLLLSLFRLLDRWSLPASAFSGFLFGLSALARPNVLLFLMLFLIWSGWKVSGDKGMRLAVSRLLLLLAVTLITIAPATIHNWASEGEFVLISSNGGANFYIGNSAEREDTVGIRPTLAWGELMAEPVRSGATSSAAKSDYFFDRAFMDIREHPGGFVKGLLVKTGRFFHGHEYPRNVDLYRYRDYSVVLSVLMWERVIAFPYGLVVPLALSGLWFFLRGKDEKRTLLIIYAAAYAGSVILFFVTSRYRMPVLPVLILLACFSVIEAVRLARSSRWKAFSVWLVTALVLGVGANWKVWEAPLPPESEFHLHLGNALAGPDTWPQALKEYKRAIELSPELPDPYLQAGVVLYRAGKGGMALEYLSAAEDRAPEGKSIAKAWIEQYRGDIYFEAGELDEAADAYKSALHNFDYQHDARLGLARVLLRQGKAREAHSHLEKLVEQYPRSARAWYELSLVQKRLGMDREYALSVKKYRELSGR